MEYQTGLKMYYSTFPQSEISYHSRTLPSHNSISCRIVFSFEMIAENVIGQENFTNGTYVSPNVALSGMQVGIHDFC